VYASEKYVGSASKTNFMSADAGAVDGAVVGAADADAAVDGAVDAAVDGVVLAAGVAEELPQADTTMANAPIRPRYRLLNVIDLPPPNIALSPGPAVAAASMQGRFVARRDRVPHLRVSVAAL